MFYVYLMRAGKSHYKVGVTKDLVKRVKAIQSGNPEPIYLVSSKLVELPYSIEAELHRRLNDLASGGGHEWFTLNDNDVIELCIYIQTYPHIELSEKIIIKDLLDRQLMWKKSVEKKLDIILNNYQGKSYKPKPTSTGEENIAKEPTIAKPDKATIYEEEVKTAAQIIVSGGRASTSLIQRRMSIGYGKASRIMDRLESDGLVGPSNGAKPREILKQK